MLYFESYAIFFNLNYRNENSGFEMTWTNKNCLTFSPCVAGVVQAGSVSNICTQIMTIVDQEQNKVLWIPDGAP